MRQLRQRKEYRITQSIEAFADRRFASLTLQRQTLGFLHPNFIMPGYIDLLKIRTLNITLAFFTWDCFLQKQPGKKGWHLSRKLHFLLTFYINIGEAVAEWSAWGRNIQENLGLSLARRQKLGFLNHRRVAFDFPQLSWRPPINTNSKFSLWNRKIKDKLQETAWTKQIGAIINSYLGHKVLGPTNEHPQRKPSGAMDRT